MSMRRDKHKQARKTKENKQSLASFIFCIWRDGISPGAAV